MRGGALLIDVMIQAAIEIALLLTVWLIDGRPVLTVGETEMVLFVVGLPVVVLYAPLLLARPGEHNGQTVGKQAMGIQVIRENGLAVTFSTAVVRETLGRQLISLLTYGLYLPVDYLWPLRDPRNQALHDKIAHTLVVAGRVRAPIPARDRPAALRTEPTGRGKANKAASGLGSGSGNGNGLPGADQPVRGDWLPPVAPTRDEAD